MSLAAQDTTSQRVLVATPTRKDAEVTQRLLGQAGIEVVTAEDLAALAAQVDEGAGAILLTDLALPHPSLPVLLAALARQPPWSALPVLVLCQPGTQSGAAMEVLDGVPNVTVLDRPASTRTLVSSLKSALRSRASQYQIRDQIARLREAEEALRQADRRKDEFLATLAHELRNPLAPLRNGIALLERLPPHDARVGHLRSMMERQLTQLVKLIDELLDVSRIATGKIVLERKVIDVREVVRSALESCEPLVAAARHQLAVALPDTPALVRGDAARLAQVVNNLVGNSIKYTPPGGHIQLRVEPVEGEWALTVSDDGVGIPPAMLEQVFELFAQVNQTLDRAQGGLGIGLSLVRRLVQLHGGRITARSEGTGRGSEFEVRLPRAAQEPVAPPVAAAPAPSTTRRLQVLVIDDNVDAADSLAMLLRSLGHETSVAYSARTGLEAAGRLQPDAVFCDIGMPGMDGFDFANALRAEPRFRKVKLVALTGWGSENDQGRTREAGFDFHLTKPADPRHVQAVLQGP